MYYLVKDKKALPSSYTMEFRSFKLFYEKTKSLSIPLVGSYTFIVKSDSYEDVKEFIGLSKNYEHLLVYILVNVALYNYLLLGLPNIATVDAKSNYAIFKEIIEKHSVLFDKGVINTLYSSIPHDYNSMNEVVQDIKGRFGSKVVYLSDIEELYIINESTYPREVLISFLLMSRNRWAQYRRCYEEMGDRVMFYAIRKNLKTLMEQKIAYMKTGEGSKLIQIISSENLVLLYNMFVLNSKKFTDCYILFTLYEKGLTL